MQFNSQQDRDSFLSLIAKFVTEMLVHKERLDEVGKEAAGAGEAAYIGSSRTTSSSSQDGHGGHGGHDGHEDSSDDEEEGTAGGPASLRGLARTAGGLGPACS